MKLAIMQPYLFPYIGYFQLMHAVDRFVVYDDVQYINRGWVNRNRIQVNGQPFLFTVPLANASQNVLIKDLRVTADEKWLTRLLRTLERSYRNAPGYAPALELVSGVLHTASPFFRDWLYAGLVAVRDVLGLSTQLVESSDRYGNQELKGEERIIDICRREHAAIYVNPIGGVSLYDEKAFSLHDISLRILSPTLTAYPQKSEAFVPGLSVIDALMHCGSAAVATMVRECNVVPPQDVSSPHA